MHLRKKLYCKNKKIYMFEGEFFYGNCLNKNVVLDSYLSFKPIWKPIEDKKYSPLEKYFVKWSRLSKPL